MDTVRFPLARVLLPLIVLLTLAGFGSGARADADSEARTRYERAIELYEGGVYDAALVELRRAYELKPSYKLLYNIAQVRLALNDYAAALESYRLYLQQAGARIPAQRRDTVQAEMAQLEQRVAALTIQSDLDGAEVLVDDLVVGTTPLAGPILVNAGLRNVVVRHPDHPPRTLRISVAGGDRRELALPLLAGTAATPDVQPASALPPAPDHASPMRASSAPAAALTRGANGQQVERRPRLLTWLGFSLTGALAAAAITTGVLAWDSSKDLQHAREHERVGANELADRRTHITRLALASDGLAIATVASAGVSVWLTLRSPVERARPTAQRRGLKLGVGATGVRVAGSF